MADADSKGKSGWYPGKYAGRSKPSSSDEKKSSSPDDKKGSFDRDEEGEEQDDSSGKDKKGWYPGKLMTKAARRVSVATSSSHGSEERRPTSRPNTSGYSSETNNEFVSDSPVEKRKPQFEHLETVGKVRVRIPAIRYLNISSATFIVELEDFAAFFDYSPESYVEFDRTFELKDITSDIVITISGNGDDGNTIAGVIVVPLVSLLGFSGTPTPAKEVWRQVYPIYTKSKTENFKFTSGFSDPQGYALTKPKESLGFVSMITELNLYHQPLKIYFFGEARCHITEYALELLSDQNESKAVSSYEESDEALNVALVNRNFQRLHNVLLPLACLSPVLHLPEVFILVGVFGFFVFSLQVYQLPLFLFCFALFNGIYTMLNRSYSKVLIWNDSTFNAPSSSPSPHSSMRVRSVSQADASNMLIVQGVLTSAASSGTAPSTTTQKTVFSVYAKHLHAIVHYLEVFSNLFSFADSRASVIFYVGLFGLAVLTSLFLSIFSFRALLLLIVSSTLLLYAGRDVVYDYFYFRIKSSKEEKAAKVMRHLTMLNAFLSKVPDELELTHRYIAGTAIVNEKGAEMSDAAAAFAMAKK